MELYRIEAKLAPHGWVLTSPAFRIVVDAGPEDLDSAVHALRTLMADEAQKRLNRGDFLPVDDTLDTPKDGSVILYMETDFGNRFIAHTSETVRRNISMPAWMDLRLRRHNIDASRLFQEAAMTKLKELEQVNSNTPNITSVQELIDRCPERVLDEYFQSRMKQILTDRTKGAENA